MRHAKQSTDLGEIIRRAIADAGVTRHRLATAAGLPYATVHGFVGGSGVTLDTASKILAALGLRIELRRTRPGKGAQ